MTILILAFMFRGAIIEFIKRIKTVNLPEGIQILLALDEEIEKTEKEIKNKEIEKTKEKGKERKQIEDELKTLQEDLRKLNKEKDVISLLMKGYNVSDICKELRMSRLTVSRYIKNGRDSLIGR